MPRGEKVRSVLIVDDEVGARESLKMILKNDYEVFLAKDAEEAFLQIKAHSPDVILLDIILPDLDGLKVLERIKQNDPDMIVIMITATKTVKTAVEAMKLGAYDYVTKPFHVRELLARVRSVLRRWEANDSPGDKDKISLPGLEVNFRTYEVTVEGKKADLGPTELKLLQFFVMNPGRVYTREQLLDHVWGSESFVEPRTVDVHISRLRAGIEKDKDRPPYILTVRGIGYRFAEIKDT